MALMIVLSMAGAGIAQPVDLSSALNEAIAQRPFARAAAARAGAALAAADEARAGYLPQLVLEERFLRTSQPGNGLFIALNQEDFSLSPMEELYTTRDNYQTRLALRQTLLSSDIYFGAKEARSGARAAESEARWRGEQAAFAAFEAYLGVQRSAAALASARSAQAEATEVLRLAQLRQQAGIGLKADALRARVALSEADRRLMTARNDLSLARRSLGLALGRGDREVEIAETLTPQLFAETGGEVELLRADLDAIAHRVRAAREVRRKAAAAYLPTLVGEASYEMHDGEDPFGNEADHWTVQIGMSWTLFDGLRRERARARTAAQQQAVEQMHREARDQANWRVREAELRSEEARAQLETVQQAVVEATESHRLLQERYAAGLTDLSDLLAVRAALDRARTDAVDAESRLILALGNTLFQRGVFVEQLLAAKEDKP